MPNLVSLTSYQLLAFPDWNAIHLYRPVFHVGDSRKPKQLEFWIGSTLTAFSSSELKSLSEPWAR